MCEQKSLIQLTKVGGHLDDIEVKVVSLLAILIQLLPFNELVGNWSNCGPQ
jgi:hypothetical protein